MSEQVTVEQLDALIAEFKRLDDWIEEEEFKVKQVRADKEALGAKIMGILKTLDRKSYKCDAGTFSRVESMRVNIPTEPEDKQALFQWLQEKGIYDQYATVNSNSLNSLYMQEFEAVKAGGDPEAILDFRIPGVGEPKLHERISFRRK